MHTKKLRPTSASAAGYQSALNIVRLRPVSASQQTNELGRSSLNSRGGRKGRSASTNSVYSPGARQNLPRPGSSSSLIARPLSSSHGGRELLETLPEVRPTSAYSQGGREPLETLSEVRPTSAFSQSGKELLETLPEVQPTSPCSQGAAENLHKTASSSSRNLVRPFSSPPGDLEFLSEEDITAEWTCTGCGMTWPLTQKFCGECGRQSQRTEEVLPHLRPQSAAHAQQNTPQLFETMKVVRLEGVGKSSRAGHKGLTLSHGASVDRSPSQSSSPESQTSRADKLPQFNPIPALLRGCASRRKAKPKPSSRPPSAASRASLNSRSASRPTSRPTSATWRVVEEFSHDLGFHEHQQMNAVEWHRMALEAVQWLRRQQKRELPVAIHRMREWVVQSGLQWDEWWQYLMSLGMVSQRESKQWEYVNTKHALNQASFHENQRAGRPEQEVIARHHVAADKVSREAVVARLQERWEKISDGPSDFDKASISEISEDTFADEHLMGDVGSNQVSARAQCTQEMEWPQAVGENFNADAPQPSFQANSNEFCSCGNCFLADEVFCRKCGRRRTEDVQNNFGTSLRPTTASRPMTANRPTIASRPTTANTTSGRESLPQVKGFFGKKELQSNTDQAYHEGQFYSDFDQNMTAEDAASRDAFTVAALVRERWERRKSSRNEHENMHADVRGMLFGDAKQPLSHVQVPPMFRQEDVPPKEVVVATLKAVAAVDVAAMEKERWDRIRAEKRQREERRRQEVDIVSLQEKELAEQRARWKGQMRQYVTEVLKPK